MLNTDELRDACYGVRQKKVPVDEALVVTIEADVAAYRAMRREPVPQLPPGDLADHLWLIGWLLYETSLSLVQKVEAAFEVLPAERRTASQESYDLVARISDAARGLPWPEFAPRALGAVRAHALAASKRDTRLGYDAAWQFHDEAREKYVLFAESHGRSADREKYLLALEEVLIQLALAETGTACREAELVIGRWPVAGSAGTRDDEDDWVQRMFRDLVRGVTTGDEALRVVAEIERTHKFVAKVDEHRLVMTSAYQNPAIMTARAALLMYSLTPELEPDRLDRMPPWGLEDWDAARARLIERFTEAYRKIEKLALDDLGNAKPLGMSHLRSLIQLRLHLALIVPGTLLPSRLPKFKDDPVPPCLDRDLLDDEAVAGLSDWLAEEVNGKQNGDANVIGSAVMPAFIRSVELCRRGRAVTSGYREWRREWFRLDRYKDEDGREERVREVLDTA